jgi:hypothetical protein
MTYTLFLLKPLKRSSSFPGSGILHQIAHKLLPE